MLSTYQLIWSFELLGFLGSLLSPLLRAGLSLIKNVIEPLSKSVLAPLGLTRAASAADAGIHKQVLRSSHNTATLIMSNEEIEDVMKIVKSLEYFSFIRERN